MTEVWKDIPGYNGKYKVSNTGNVKSFIKYSNGYLLAPNDNGKGYLSVQLGRNNRQYIHRLVARCFLTGKISEINHKDLNKSNNSVNNLEYVTRQYNQRHMIKHGKHNRAQLTTHHVNNIRALSSYGLPNKILAEMYAVSKSTISNIIRKKTWEWLTEYV